MDYALPQGYLTAGTHCGIKSNPAANDIALFVSRSDAAAAGVFTTNRVCGAPVAVTRTRVPADVIRAVLINSGNANACTGEQGLADARWMTQRAASALGCREEQVLVCSTGIIGKLLDRNVLDAGIGAAASMLQDSPAALEGAARGMMTTDTVPKCCVRTIELDGKTITVTGVAKGAAMIAPNMATMLACVLTDARVGADELQRVLAAAVDETFNCITVDNHTSTSDTVLLLANGASEAAVPTTTDGDRFAAAVTDVCRELAQLIIRDAEGAEHFVTVDVRGLPEVAQARRIAAAVCNSPLVKTAITGNDPNWGRIVSAAGYAGVPFDERDASLSINGTRLYERGQPVPFDEASVSGAMADGEVHIELEFGSGEGAIRYWTTDLTAEYVRLNADYTT